MQYKPLRRPPSCGTLAAKCRENPPKARENTEEIGVLRDAIDEEKEVMEWAAQNDKPIFRLTSMPVDPTAEDWAARVNALTPSDLPPELQTAGPHGTSAASEQASPAQPQTEQKQLWS